MNTKLSEPINKAIMENELNSQDWKYNELATDLYWWSSAFNIMFFKDEPVPIPALTFEKGDVRTRGHFRIGYNDFGIKNEIGLNNLYLSDPYYQTLGALLHEMTHVWEYEYLPENDRTKNWYHKNAFRKKLESFGIESTDKGIHSGYKDPFLFFLRRHGVQFKDIPNSALSKGLVIEVDPRKKPKGRSKLMKYVCKCNTPIRSGRKDLEILCLKCNSLFELQEQ